MIDENFNTRVQEIQGESSIPKQLEEILSLVVQDEHKLGVLLMTLESVEAASPSPAPEPDPQSPQSVVRALLNLVADINNARPRPSLRQQSVPLSHPGLAGDDQSPGGRWRSFCEERRPKTR